jgi:hypothetical protein
MKRTALVVVEHTPHSGAIPQYDLSRLVLDVRGAHHRPSRGVKGIGCLARAQIVPCTGLGCRRFREGNTRRLVCLEWPGGRGRLKGRGAPTILQHTAFGLDHRIGHFRLAAVD